MVKGKRRNREETEEKTGKKRGRGKDGKKEREDKMLTMIVSGINGSWMFFVSFLQLFYTFETIYK